jgi:hypothetical protein
MKILLIALLLVLTVNSCRHEVRKAIVALKSAANNRYVSAPFSGSHPLIANLDYAGTD